MVAPQLARGGPPVRRRAEQFRLGLGVTRGRAGFAARLEPLAQPAHRPRGQVERRRPRRRRLALLETLEQLAADGQRHGLGHDGVPSQLPPPILGGGTSGIF